MRHPSTTIAGALAGAFALTGCGHVPVATILTLAQADVVAIDPADVRVAVRYPDILRPRPGGARLTLQTWTEGANEATKTDFVLIEEKQGAALTRLNGEHRRGDVLAMFRLSSEDAQRARQMQADHRRAVAKDGRRPARLDAAVDACRLGALPEGPIRASTFLMLEPAQGFMPVVVDLDLRRQFGDRALDANLPPC